jgi:hypothetical protein
MPKIIIDRNATIHGRGSDRFKWVSGLSQESRTALRDGSDTIVLIPDNNPHYTCSQYKQVFRYGNKFYHRNAPESIIKQIMQEEARQ